MSISFCIASGKGGVGKSTFTANLGAVLAHRGSSVIIVDMDIGLRSQDALLSLGDHGMSGVGAALVADDHVSPCRQDIDDFAFAFIAPLGANQDSVHGISLLKERYSILPNFPGLSTIRLKSPCRSADLW